MYVLLKHTIFDVMSGDAVRHVNFALHWLLAFENAWTNVFNDCSVRLSQNDLILLKCETMNHYL